MKFVMELGGLKLLLTAEQVDAITNTLAGVEQLENKYVGKDVSPTNYVMLISPAVLHDAVKVGLMDEDTYGAMKLTTKLFREKHADK